MVKILNENHVTSEKGVSRRYYLIANIVLRVIVFHQNVRETLGRKTFESRTKTSLYNVRGKSFFLYPTRYWI